MRVLVIGGTHFVGRAFVEEAVRRGNDVTVFHRGASEPEGFPEVDHVHGDRDGGLDPLLGTTWDSVLDTCGYVPRVVREATDALAAAGHYTFVSSLSALPDDMFARATEETPTHQPPFPETEEVTNETYGPLKVACEREASRAFGERCLIIRPGYIVGPHDPTDRFTFYVRRAASGGEMLAPGDPDEPLQVFDVRDLATFMMDRIERRASGVYGVVGPGEPITMSGALETARDVANADTSFTWASAEFLKPFGDQAFEWFPMWDPGYPGIHTYDMSKALAAGLRHRPFSETVSDSLVWDRERGLPELRSGLPADKEQEILRSWHAGHGTAG